MQVQLRIGYAVLRERLLQPFLQAQRLYEPFPAPLLEQLALAQFMASGGYERHLRRMGRLYSRRFELFGRLLERWLQPFFEVVPSDLGLHVFAYWRRTETGYEGFKELCKEEGVEWETEGGSENAAPSGCFIFSHLTEARITEGLERMKAAAAHLSGR